MQINLTELFSQTVKDVTIRRTLEMDQLEFGGEIFEISEPIKIEFEVTQLGEGEYLTQGKVEAALVMYCNRCMNEVISRIEGRFTKELNENIDDPENDEMKDYYKNSILNVKKLALDEIYMNVPMKVLCNESCQGICKVCGADLNQEACNCEDDNVDPRLAGLKDLFNERFKEV
ncbi:YceD family protein [Petrocella sp. FN5]|uniref:YceD family protein n=1 Tax=Petrocella sp. FN5 TaxID=3032002 RepID=UPI0023D9F719|nr:DUF177 domain-containing protein [Petrocella sp. FN5]MDF1616396.1 DUF177 domain-containing protein [Petrocella sp. FN5]